ncbi:MAG TPA: DUF4252 domain-containing protein [Candidatus Krumholzibacteria bacterium]|nr:DUF4252 domain-containing protein [Candidatus Krumholzibacteria bacterium]HPD72931.1 DUF4252 domain-containing protein [Candidatus Krumholzibacteria bacterium]HRY41730.1 DUF4252 domain-containing protein [Candidatus Krumholzibacteria bacterium]
MTNSRNAGLAILVLALGLAPLAAAGSLEKEPGYLDLEWITIPKDAGEIRDVDLSTMLVDIAADAEKDGDQALVEALAMIRSVRVKSFSVEDLDQAQIARDVDKVLAELEKSDWNRLIYVKDDEEQVTVSTKRHENKTVGLVVVAYSPGDEVTYLNVVGDLDIAKLLQLAGSVDLDDLEVKLEEHEGRRVE